MSTTRRAQRASLLRLAPAPAHLCEVGFAILLGLAVVAGHGARDVVHPATGPWLQQDNPAFEAYGQLVARRQPELPYQCHGQCDLVSAGQCRDGGLCHGQAPYEITLPWLTLPCRAPALQAPFTPSSPPAPGPAGGPPAPAPLEGGECPAK